MTRKVPCALMRGGTSRGPVLLASDLPTDPRAREAVLLAIMGSPDPLQLDGVGGGRSLTSKAAIVSRSSEPGADVDYLFAQVDVQERRVDLRPNCGNMMAAVAPFAIEAGLVRAGDRETVVRIFNVNTRTHIEATVQTPGGQVRYEGDTVIDGVREPAAAISLAFLDAPGAVTGRLFPTGRSSESIDGVPVTCIDMAMPLVIASAESLGKTGHESPEELDADGALKARLEAIRREAALRMGLGDVSESVVPKPVLVSRPRRGGSIASRYFTPHACHRSHAATGALAVATATMTDGCVPAALASSAMGRGNRVVVEHPAGRIEVALDMAEGRVRRASLVRTARLIFEGHVRVPDALYA